jgi:hypothetical protein
VIACEVNRVPNDIGGIVAQFRRTTQGLLKKVGESSGFSSGINPHSRAGRLLTRPRRVLIYDFDKHKLGPVLLDRLGLDAISQTAADQICTGGDFVLAEPLLGLGQGPPLRFGEEVALDRCRILALRSPDDCFDSLCFAEGDRS